MPKWDDLILIFRVRAAEEAGVPEPFWNQDTLRSATRLAADRTPTPAQEPSALLRTRSLILLETASRPLPEAVHLPSIPRWVCVSGWLGAFVAGWGLTALGQENEINLLALPLLGILLWNLIVMGWSLFSGPGRAKSSPSQHSLGSRLLQRLPHQGAGPVHQRFLDLVRVPWLRRFHFRFRVWLHVGAALLALGSITGMYARSWSKEYRAVWESTLLDNRATQRFLQALFTPASRVFGLPLPLEDIAAMRRGVAHPATRPAPALPWIHLYAATLILFITLPRLLLACVDLRRSRQALKLCLQNDDWKAYTGRLLTFVDGAGASVLILAHGLPVDETASDHWRTIAHSRWPDMGAPSFRHIPTGSESAFAAEWSPPTDKRVLLVFNLASVPEMEVHHWLADQLLSQWRRIKDHPDFAIALDDTQLRKRWSGFVDYPSRLDQRLLAWQKALQDLPSPILPPRPLRTASNHHHPS